ncbi:hypothetical protein [Maribacter stanieri]|uniref:Phage abortive infection protein n=1 Tax=Maribacter stanieri TaxID=440514 RepID=A0A1I6IEP4_9FLAO|nr:hypothetical protein [Maribacter stanieri]SFR65166.1 hypothetical protein SAMN04488010_1579 [Maribacter stanieri]
MEGGKPKKLIGFNNWEIAGIGIFLLIIVIAPWLLTNYYTGIHFNGLGDIGDVIGGVTAPFVNLLAAYLVYKSFKAQIEANAQQNRNHKIQMDAILSEQTINFLLNLYNNIEKDYYENDKKDTSIGWGNVLHNGFEKINDSYKLKQNPSEDYDATSDTYQSTYLLETAIKEIKYSIDKVFFTYHNFSIITDILLKSLNTSNDKNVIYTIKYVTAKIENLFISNSYDSILSIEIKEYVPITKMRTDMKVNLKALKQTGRTIHNKLSYILATTEEKLVELTPKE